MVMEKTVQSRGEAQSYTQFAHAVSQAARQYYLHGDTVKAMQLLRSTLNYSEEDINLPDKALLMADLGGMIWKHGHYKEALQLVTDARWLADQVGDEFSLTTALYHLGELAYVKAFMMQAGEVKDALVYHEQCLALRQETDDHTGITLSLSRIGVLHERLKDDEKAIVYFEKAIELSKDVDYPLGLIRPYTHIAGRYRRQGDHHTALTFYQKALTLSQELNDYENIIFGLTNVGMAKYRLDGDPEAALSHLQHALKLAQRINFIFATGRAYHALAEVSLKAGDKGAALGYFEKLTHVSAKDGYSLFSGLAYKRIEEIKRQELLHLPQNQVPAVSKPAAWG